jgi:hypothetical protein
MSQQAYMLKQKEFMTTLEMDKGRNMNRASPQFYRIVIRSKDRTSGTRSNAIFSNINFNEYFSSSAVLFADTFILQNKDTNALVGESIEISIKGIPQPRTFDTGTMSATEVLCAFTGYSYQNQSPDSNAVGIPILNPTQFQNQPINIYFKKTDGTALADFAGDWVLVLNVVSYDGSTSLP